MRLEFFKIGLKIRLPVDKGSRQNKETSKNEQQKGVHYAHASTEPVGALVS